MREIKFRVWDKVEKRYNSERGAYFIRQDGVLNHELASIGGIDPDGKMSYCSTNYPLVSDGYVVQQFTGIKDKNGQDIHEGDLISFIERICLDYKVARKNIEVIFQDGCFGFKNEFKFHPLTKAESIEVVGNIFEKVSKS